MIAQPAAVLMENVPDMALDKDMFILRTMVHELESLGYAVEERVVDTSQYGVPQFRQRLILVALREGMQFTWPSPLPDQVTVWNAIGDLPSVEGGSRPPGGAEGWIPYKGPKNPFQRRMREGIDTAKADRIYDHITRPVREDDKIAFEWMDAKTRYSQLPEELRRYRADIFDDKYKRLDANGLSRTITAHIAKDGYWYIHPKDAALLPFVRLPGSRLSLTYSDSLGHLPLPSVRSEMLSRPSWADSWPRLSRLAWRKPAQPGHQASAPGKPLRHGFARSQTLPSHGCEHLPVGR